MFAYFYTTEYSNFLPYTDPKSLLSEEDLLTVQNGERLTDVHITAAQKLIQKQFPHLDGLQSPLLSQGDRFLPMVDGVQIHHIGNHWVTSSSIGGKITVYDSYYGYTNSLLHFTINWHCCTSCWSSQKKTVKELTLTWW